MDAVNRKVSLTNIINNAQLERRCLALLPTLHILSLLRYQFIFLSPLNMDGIEVGDDCKIVRLSKRPA